MSSLLHYFILVATDLPHSYCCCCQNLCCGSVHWHRLQNVQLSPIVSCAGTACMEKQKTKIFSPIHVSKFVPRGFLSVFSYFSGWKLFTEQEEASGMQEEEGRAAWGGIGAWGTQRHNQIKLQEERDGAMAAEVHPSASLLHWLCMTQSPLLLSNRLSCFKYEC